MEEFAVEFEEGLTGITVEDLKGARVEIGPSEYANLEDWINNTAGGFSTSNFGGVDGWGQFGGGSPYNQDLQQRADFFTRNEFRMPRSIMDEFRLAYDLVARDDIVSAVGDLTEGLAIQRMKWECEDLDEEDLWNQISRDLDLDARLKEMWRELYGMSQFYCAMFWGNKSYTVRGKTKKGNRKRKTFNVKVPIAMSLLDPTRVVPVGHLMFGKERLAWVATQDELEKWDNDPILGKLCEGHYMASEAEQNIFGKMAIDAEQLLLFKPDAVWRHTLTKPAYKRWADVRLKSVFPLADLKVNLRMMERAHLIGGTNFIVVVKKGTDKIPARQQELNNLDSQVRKLARVPLLVGDHRLSVEIVTPKLDMTLNEAKWDTLDKRIGARCLMSLSVGGDSAKKDDSLTVGRAVARGIESRRHGLSRAIEKNIVDKVMAVNPDLDARPSHAFAPKHLALDWDAGFVQILLALRDRGDISRETILDEVDFSQDIEAKRREFEEEFYDDIFQTAVPFDSPQNNSQPGAAKPAVKPASTAQPKSGAAQGRQGGNDPANKVQAVVSKKAPTPSTTKTTPAKGS